MTDDLGKSIQAKLRAVLKQAKADRIILSFDLRPGGRATIYPWDGGKYYTTGTLDTLTTLERIRDKRTGT